MDHICKTLLDAIKYSIQDSLGAPSVHKTPIGVAFSGGVDSTLLAVLCNKAKYDIVLLTVGFSKSHDVEFAHKIASKLSFKHHTSIISDRSDFTSMYNIIRKKITYTDSLSWLENTIAFYYLAQLAHQKSISKIVTANGIDELFCGYDAYRRLLESDTKRKEITTHYKHAIDNLMHQKLDNELHMFRTIEKIIRSDFGISLYQPLLHPEFCKVAYNIPLSEKITGYDDMYRKHAIRRLAREVGVPTISHEKRKKALQYGTGIHKAILKIKKNTL